MQAKPYIRERIGMRLYMPRKRQSLGKSLICSLLLSAILAGGQTQSRDIRVEKPRLGKVTRRALLVGNNEYRSANGLANAVKDAGDMEGALKALGFATTLRVNQTAAGFASSLKGFAATVEPGDVAFFFYAGHGIQIDGVNYIIPIDFNARNEAEAKRMGQEVGGVQAALQRTGAGLTIMTIDACRNNPDPNAPKEFRTGFVPMRSGAGGLIAFSTGPGERSDDGIPGMNGLFTSYLLSSINQPLPIVGVFRRVRDLVFKASGEHQRPYLMDDVIGEYYLAGQANAKPAQDFPSPVSAEADSALLRGLYFYHAGDYAAAAQAFDLARRIRPAEASAYNAAGLAYAKQGRLQIAADLFSRAIALNPAYSAAYLNRALIYLEIPNYPLAIQDLSWTIDFDANDPVPHHERGRAYLGMRQYELAAADFRRAIKLFPRDYDALRGLGVVAYRLNDFLESLRNLNRSIADKSDFVEAYEDRARTYKALGRATDAENDRLVAAKLRSQH